MATSLPFLCSEVQEHIVRLLSVRDLLALGSVCWQAEVMRFLSRIERRTRGITTINRCNIYFVFQRYNLDFSGLLLHFPVKKT